MSSLPLSTTTNKHKAPPLNGFAFHTLRDRMPELSEAEAHIIVIAAAGEGKRSPR